MRLMPKNRRPCFSNVALLLGVLGWLTPGALSPQNCYGQQARVEKQLQRSEKAYLTSADWTKRRRELRTGFLKGAGLWPLPLRGPVKVIAHSRREHDGYSVENVALETMPGFFCTGNLYRPLDLKQPGPGILCPHGHFRPLGRYRASQQIRSAHFARMGATVFSYSMVGWQDSQQTTHDDPMVLALQTWNSLRALDYLAQLKEVDPNRLGVTGASGGGTQTFFLAALDDRVRVSSPVVIVYPWTAPQGCLCEGGLPVMQETETNAIELAASSAPRAQLVISVGAPDPTQNFPQFGYPFMQRVYEIHKAADHLQLLHLDTEKHDFGPSKRTAVYEFFAKHLNLSPQPEATETITIESPQALQVFGDNHPLPAHAIHGSTQIAKSFSQLPRPQ